MRLLAPLELAGASVLKEHKLDGQSLAPLLRGERPSQQRRLFWGFRHQRAMRDGPWKLVVSARGQKGRPALFHLAEDLAEKNDLAAEQSDRVAQMFSAVERWEREVGPSEFVEKGE